MTPKVFASVLLAFILHPISPYKLNDLCSLTAVSEEIDAASTVIACPCTAEDVCVRKCCKPGYYLNESAICSRVNPTPTLLLNLTIYKDKVVNDGWVVLQSEHILVAPLECSFYMLDPSQFESDRFFVQRDGRLFWDKGVEKKYFSSNEYCVDSNENVTESVAFLCFEDQHVDSEKKFNHRNISFVTGRF